MPLFYKCDYFANRGVSSSLTPGARSFAGCGCHTGTILIDCDNSVTSPTIQL